ncbi:MAG: energy transducer TonB [Gammaproteobacteria bacterium]|nr:energy transducer TonB [Gammaproteobacteria bacterium]
MTEKVVKEPEREMVVDLLQAIAEPVLITMEKTSVEVSRPQPVPPETSPKSVQPPSETLPVSRMAEPVHVEPGVETPAARHKEESPAVVESQPQQPVSARSSPPSTAKSSEHAAPLPEGPLVIAPQRSGVPDEDGWGAFKNAVIEHLERFRNYPRQARDRGISGVVHLQFVIDANGRVEQVDVMPPRESHPLLEQAAMDTIRRASPLPDVPERLKKAARVTLRFAMQYELQ